MRLCAQGELRVPLASVRDKNGGEARLYPLELKETAATGYLRLQLQLNSVSVPAPRSPLPNLAPRDVATRFSACLCAVKCNRPAFWPTSVPRCVRACPCA